jgi:hypothetical protein
LHKFRGGSKDHSNLRLVVFYIRLHWMICTVKRWVVIDWYILRVRNHLRFWKILDEPARYQQIGKFLGLETSHQPNSKWNRAFFLLLTMNICTLQNNFASKIHPTSRLSQLLSSNSTSLPTRLWNDRSKKSCDILLVRFFNKLIH